MGDEWNTSRSSPLKATFVRTGKRTLIGSTTPTSSTTWSPLAAEAYSVPRAQRLSIATSPVTSPAVISSEKQGSLKPTEIVNACRAKIDVIGKEVVGDWSKPSRVCD